MSDVPVNGAVNGKSCILVSDEAKITARFKKFDDVLYIPYGMICCVQFWDKTILINIHKDDKLLTYLVTSSSAKKLYDIMIKNL